MRSKLGWLGVAASLAWGMLAPCSAQAASPYTEAPPHEEVIASAAYRYANMSNDEALAELDRRGIRYRRVDAIGTVRAPIRLEGALNGVHIHSALPEAERADSMFEILDARLALALDDFSVILARHDVVELVHYTMYRPNMPAPGSPEEKAMLASQKQQERAKLKAKDPKSKDPKSKPVDEKVRIGKSSKTPAAAKPANKSLAKGEKPNKGPRRVASDKRKETAREELVHKAEFHAAVEELHACGHDHTGEDHVGDENAKLGPNAKSREPQQAHPPSRVRGLKSGAKAGKSAKTTIGPKNGNLGHGKWAPPGTRHPAGLAIDVGILRKADGTALNVAQHFQGKIGERTCGENAPVPESDAAKELHAIVCEARESEVFTYTLTPNFDAAHFDHFHMEIKPGVEWFLYH